MEAHNRPQQQGFTYLAILFAVALAGVVLTQTGMLWSHENQREKEQELLFVGDQYRQAIRAYYEQTPSAAKQYPPSLQHLLEDNRFNPPRRHLRKLYRDPLTAQQDWGLIKAPQGGIMGVYSQSPKQPIKRHNFRERDQAFEKASTYRDWEFSHAPAAENNANSAAGGGAVNK